ncbi:tetratricopeptide repeat protein [Roseomonas sp. JC162]|uniref:Tetratricopeptide repeat protein n=1 Tax=Neoroseomonas marina TaxID=1232220 RepID=A0A848E5T6_9PROT|nr:tetratricopeptide repeat protein [Neoroseomonas marina]NMJ39784.1 tetratricopeptide repeat protein [Neoroseomonas marina]
MSPPEGQTDAGAPDAALEAMRAAIAAAPCDPRLHADHVALLRALRRTDEAVAAARAAVAATPLRAPAHVLLGETLAWAQRRPAALAAFARARELDPANRRALLGAILVEPAAAGGQEVGPLLRGEMERLTASGAPATEWLALTAALRDQGRVPVSITVAAHAAAALPAEAALHLCLGTLRMAARRAVEAEPAFREAARLDPSLLDAWLGLTDALWRQRRIPEGVAALAEAVALHPDNAALASRQATFLVAAHEPVAAERAARRALTLDAQDESAWLCLGDAIWRQHRQRDSVRAIEEGLVAMPDSVALAARLGHLLISQDRRAAAVDAFRRAVAGDQAPAHVWLGLTDALWRAGRAEEAAEAVRQGLAAHPNSAELRARLAQLLMAGGEVEGARTTLAEALATDPGSEDVQLAMADALWRQGRRAEAVAAAREAVATVPDNPAVAARLGHLLLEAGEIAEAAAIFERVTAQAPKLVTGWVGLCDAERERKNIKAAIAALRRAEAAGADRPTLRMLRYRLFGDLEE